MGIEIERKFLIDSWLLPQPDKSVHVIQGYLSIFPAVRIRIIDGLIGKITIKGKGTLSKPEFEYDIPVLDAQQMMTMSLERIEKVRHYFVVENHTWEVDQFIGKLSGLWVGEIELNSEDEIFNKPSWALAEVTEDNRYSNVALAMYGNPKDRKE